MSDLELYLSIGYGVLFFTFIFVSRDYTKIRYLLINQVIQNTQLELENMLLKEEIKILKEYEGKN